MIYYQPIKADVVDRKTGFSTVENELLTTRERREHFPTLKETCFRRVEVSQKKCYWFFGARFALDTAQVTMLY